MTTVDVITAIMTFLVAPTTAIITWRLSRRKTNAEADSTIVSGAKTTVDTMHLVMNELRFQIEALNTEAEKLRQENAELRRQLRELKVQIRALSKIEGEENVD